MPASNPCWLPLLSIGGGMGGGGGRGRGGAKRANPSSHFSVKRLSLIHPPTPHVLHDHWLSTDLAGMTHLKKKLSITRDSWIFKFWDAYCIVGVESISRIQS